MFLERKFIFITTLFSVLICVLLLLIKVYVSFSFLPDISGSETSTILPIQRLLDGLPIYTDSEEPPFLMTQYAPIYFVITSTLLKIVGFLPIEVHKVFIMSRLVSIGFTLLTILVIWLILRKNKKIHSLTAILASCFIFQILSFWFLTSSRPDSLLVLLTSLFVYAVYEAIESKNNHSIWWILAILISVTAFFVKQSGAIHSIVLGMFCIVQGQWKLVLKLIGFGILFFIIYLFILPISSLSIFFMNIVGGVANSASWGWFYDWTLQRLLLQFAPLLAINVAVVAFIFKSKKSPFLLFLSISSIAFFLFATLTALKIGAGVGYYQDYLIVAVILLVTYFAENNTDFNLENSFNMLVTCMYLCFVSIHCLLYVYMSYTNVPLSNFKGKYI
ncbi:MAG: Dolichyl-phosphate-mannose-protein mannosyltransferase, partial [Rhodoglobus sp.]|nr:Dolichyl-phosphate-mannose-protein mannosyltransferase [Rhodoglobus sp.]